MSDPPPPPAAPPAPPAPPPPPATTQASSSTASTSLSDSIAKSAEKRQGKETKSEVTLQWATPPSSKNKCVRIVVMSDTHNRVDDLIVPPGDILIHCGDFTNKGTQEEVKNFNHFLGTLPHKHKLVICGNHEQELAKVSNMKHDVIQQALSNCTYIQDNAVEIEGIKFYGTPWTLGRMAFGSPYDQIDSHWKKIPKDTDVLITHNPPLMILDLAWVGGKPSDTKNKCEHCHNVHVQKTHWGCPHLARRVLDISPKVHVFGHVHDDDGYIEKDGVMYVNAAADIHHTVYFFDIYPELLHSKHKKKKFLFF